MNIAVYPSDHGYGHISRQLGWIEKIISEDNIFIYIISKNVNKLLSQSQKSKKFIKIIPRLVDFGLSPNDLTFSINYNKTKNLFDLYLNQIQNLINKEKKFIQEKSINLIVSDISPIPIQAAHECNIESLAISSFTWKWILDYILPKHPIIEKYESFYKNANNAFVLPLGEKMDIFQNKKNIPLIARTNKKSYNLLKKQDINKRKIFFSMGYSIFPDLSHLKYDEKIYAIYPEHLSMNYNGIRIPNSYKNISNFIDISDFTVVKTGYSSVAESIVHKKPILGIKRRGINEDEVIGKWIEKFRLGETIYFHDLSTDFMKSFDYKKYLSSYQNLPKRIQNNGYKTVINWIKSLKDS